MKIGDIVYVFDANRRRYAPNVQGFNPPIYREHWRPEPIRAETSRSWIIGGRSKAFGMRKIPKNGPIPWDIVTSDAALDDRCWIHEHARYIGTVVGGCEDASVLRQIAALVGYNEGTKSTRTER